MISPMYSESMLYISRVINCELEKIHLEDLYPDFSNYMTPNEVPE